jgi:hypothetical protein
MHTWEDLRIVAPQSEREVRLLSMAVESITNCWGGDNNSVFSGENAQKIGTIIGISWLHPGRLREDGWLEAILNIDWGCEKLNNMGRFVIANRICFAEAEDGDDYRCLVYFLPPKPLTPVHGRSLGWLDRNFSPWFAEDAQAYFEYSANLAKKI